MRHQGSQILESPRLILRPYRVEDAEDMYHNWAKDPEVSRYLTWQAYSSVDEVKATLTRWQENYSSPSFYTWAICLKASPQDPIGSISIGSVNDKLASGEIGYCLGQAYWSQGLATEALAALLVYAFQDIGFHRLVARHRLENPASGRVMEKVGMVYEGLPRGAGKDNQGRFVDLHQYASLRTDRVNWS